jgi:hypothetical protein
VDVLRHLARLRWALLAVVWLAGLPRHFDIRQGDWHFFVRATDLLASHGPGTGLHVLAAHRELTMGPVSLGVTELLRLGGSNGLARAQVLGFLLAPATLFLLERAALRVREGSDRVAVQLTTLVGGAMLLQAWPYASGEMTHLDDVLATAFAALAVWAVAARRPWVLVAAVALAAASNAYGVFLLPLCLAPRLTRPYRTTAAAIGAMVVPWLPFVLADPGTIGGGSYTQAVDPSSALAALGVHARLMPGWVRPTQVLLGLALAALVARRGHWGGAVAIALAARLALDPQVYGYYTLTYLTAALALDLLGARRVIPIATTATYAALQVVPSWLYDQSVLSRLRLLDAVALAGLALLLPRNRPPYGVHMSHVRHAQNRLHVHVPDPR